jgi:hypothetical protein
MNLLIAMVSIVMIEKLQAAFSDESTYEQLQPFTIGLVKPSLVNPNLAKSSSVGTA